MGKQDEFRGIPTDSVLRSPPATQVSQEDIFQWLLWSPRRPHERTDAPLLRRWANILWLRYCTPHAHTLREVADILGTSHERVRQIEGDALNKLRREPYPWIQRAQCLNPDSKLARAIFPAGGAGFLLPPLRANGLSPITGAPTHTGAPDARSNKESLGTGRSR